MEKQLAEMILMQNKQLIKKTSKDADDVGKTKKKLNIMEDESSGTLLGTCAQGQSGKRMLFWYIDEDEDYIRTKQSKQFNLETQFQEMSHLDFSKPKMQRRVSKRTPTQYQTFE